MIELDVHTHLAPINAQALEAIPGATWDPVNEALTLDGHRVGMRDLFHAERLIARMDSHQIRRALVSIPPPLYRQHLPADQALVWTRYLNDELLKITERSDGRLAALYYLPLEHPDLLNTLCEGYETAAFEGIALAAGGHANIVYSRKEYDVLWQWLDDCKAFVFLHPGCCQDPRLTAFYLENLIGNPMETGVAAAHLVMAGIPERYPDIRFCLAHAGGTFPSLVGRMERGFDTQRPGVDTALERPLQSARRFYVDNIAHHPGLLTLAGQVVGQQHVVYGSDWPFPMGPADA
ncbi:amidohydrolase family protein [Pseudomonas marginalis]|nr:amidohydrolase family protein [Pseudomonas marginalis]